MSINTDEEKIEALLTRGVAEAYPNYDKFKALLTSGEQLRIYHGIDPTGPDLHIGHAIQLRKLREFQDLGHEVILLLGSFTAMIGDPTDKDATRKPLTREDVMKNAATYKEQASKILSFEGENQAQIKFNHEWLEEMNFADVIDLASHFTVQQMMERDMFEKRAEAGKPIHIHEFMYPLMQGYDSVAMEVDIEIGGSDQTFNMLAGRTLLRQVKQKEKYVLASKLLENNEGKKMSKSEGGFIALGDAPEEMYGKLMAMSDGMILPYFELVTNRQMEEINGMKLRMEQGENPRDIKAELAHEVVTAYHSEDDAKKAEVHFDQVFRQKEIPEEITEFSLRADANIIDLLVETGLTVSKSDARRMIEQGAVKLDGVKITDKEMIFETGKGEMVLSRGKRNFVRIIS
jgi:tyrosyl-tRNA synthetase